MECTDPSLLQDCIAGQKWKCVNEEGRWRKHKCKFHKEVQDHLAEINKYLTAQQTRRNCACFTPNGVVYTKIKAERDIFQQKQKRNHRRSKRDADYDEEYKMNLPPEFLNLLRMDEILDNLENKILEGSSVEKHSRKKRDADYITQTIDELHSVLLSLEKKYLNNSTKNPVQCFVEQTGKVNCSTIVYENEEAWRQSRLQIDMLIKVLKDKIGNLKDIKKHLKENRPANMTATGDDEVYENFSNSIEVEEETEENRSTTTKEPQHHHHRHHQNGKKRQKTTTALPFPTTEDATSASSPFSITESELAENSSVTWDEPSSTTEATKSTTSKQRSRTRSTKSTTTAVPFSTEDAPTSSDDYLTSEASIDSTLSTTSQSIDITPDSQLSSTEATKTVKKHNSRQPQQHIFANSVNQVVNITASENENSENKSGLPAECYCEPEIERFVISIRS